MRIKAGKMDGTKGWNNVTWLREVEMTEEEFNSLIKGMGYEYQTIGTWSRYDDALKEISVLAVIK